MEIGHESGTRIGCGGMFFGLFWTAFSSIFLLLGLWMVWGALDAKGWDRAPCVIERFEISADKEQKPPFRADLRYRYEIDGKSHTGTRLWADKEGSDSYEDLAEIREALAQGPEGPLASLAGVATECWVKPGEPETSALVKHESGQIWGGIVFTVFGALFVMVGIGLLLSGKSGGSRKTVSSSGDGHPFLMVIFFLVFACAGLGVLGGLVIPKTAEWMSMRSWQETSAEVIWSRVLSKSDSDGTTYAVDLLHRYEIDGREYRSNRYDILGGSSSGSKDKRAVVRAHPPGSRLTVFVNPEKPWRAVVNRSPGWWGLFALFPLPFLAVGFGGLWWCWRKRGEGKSVSRASGRRPAKAHGPAPKSLVAGRWVRSGGSRIGPFVGLLIFALIWNGFVWFALGDAWEGPGGTIDTIFGVAVSLFMIPFLLVGVGVAIGALYLFFALFGPRYEILIESGDLAPGAATRVRWRRAGGMGRPRDFSLVLMGREEATYSQGSSTSTARSVFREVTLFETTDGFAMAGGDAALRIPPDAAPTFSGRHNRLRWLLCLRAKVPRLPDLRDEREILVRPLRRDELP